MILLNGYEYFLGFLLIAAAVPILALVTNLIVTPKGRTGERKLTYESGMEPIGGAWIQFNIRYYMFALVFVIFDVETVFLYPWAVAFNRLGLLANKSLINAYELEGANPPMQAIKASQQRWESILNEC